jgi:hypothetical protein
MCLTAGRHVARDGVSVSILQRMHVDTRVCMPVRSKQYVHFYRLNNRSKTCPSASGITCVVPPVDGVGQDPVHRPGLSCREGDDGQKETQRIKGRTEKAAPFA